MNNFDKKNPVALALQQDVSTNEFVEGYITNNFNIDLFDSQVSDINKEITNRFEPKKQQSDYLSLVYQYLDMCRRAERVSTCGSVLEFGIYPDKARLQFANFCKDRLCPMCNWRRSLKLYGQVSAVMDVLEEQGYQFLFLTLTIKNCSASDLPKTIDILLDLPSAQPEPRWIPCERELPAVGRSVLISVGGIYTAEGCLRDDGDWTQFRWDSIQRKDMVGAWKPLPEPYKGEQE